MAGPTLMKELTILLGDGGEPETFAWPCGAAERTISFKNNYSEEVVLDCDDPLNAASALVRALESQDTEVSISGVLAKGSVFTSWRGWADSGDPKNIRIDYPMAAADGGGHYDLPAVIENFELTGSGKGWIKFTATIKGAGARVWTAAT